MISIPGKRLYEASERLLELENVAVTQAVPAFGCQELDHNPRHRDAQGHAPRPADKLLHGGHERSVAQFLPALHPFLDHGHERHVKRRKQADGGKVGFALLRSEVVVALPATGNLVGGDFGLGLGGIQGAEHPADPAPVVIEGDGVAGLAVAVPGVNRHAGRAFADDRHRAGFRLNGWSVGKRLAEIWRKCGVHGRGGLSTIYVSIILTH